MTWGPVNTRKQFGFLLLEKAKKALEQLDDQSIGSLQAYLNTYGNEGPSTMIELRWLRPEGRHGGGRHVWAIAYKQVRLYGGELTLDGLRTFVGVEIVKKKTRRADQELLHRVANALNELEAKGRHQ